MIFINEFPIDNENLPEKFRIVRTILGKTGILRNLEDIYEELEFQISDSELSVLTNDYEEQSSSTKIYDRNIIDSFDLVDSRTGKYIGDIVEFDESERQWQRWFATDGKFELDWVRGTLGGQRWTIWGEIEAKPNAIEQRLRIWIQLRIYSCGQEYTGRIDAKFGCNEAGELDEQNGMEDLNEIFAQFDAEGFKKIEKALPLFALMS